MPANDLSEIPLRLETDVKGLPTTDGRKNFRPINWR
jgi:hypothetical protein